VSSNPEYPITAPGIWLEFPATPEATPRPGLFLDRDGVVIEDTDFIDDPGDVRLMPGAAALIRRANDADIPVVLITNQSGIDRGHFTWAKFAAVQDEMKRQLGNKGARIDAVAACPFHADHTPDFGPGHAAWRKPGPRMIETMCESMNINAGASWMVGDRSTDMAAAREAGLKGAVHLLTGHGPDHRQAALEVAREIFRMLTADTVEECHTLLLAELISS
jgi:D-glycero-D-manno-heptose 1,7-bisphosphate phosphatase